jgi:hypothetical protein
MTPTCGIGVVNNSIFPDLIYVDVHINQARPLAVACSVDILDITKEIEKINYEII